MGAESEVEAGVETRLQAALDTNDYMRFKIKNMEHHIEMLNARLLEKEIRIRQLEGDPLPVTQTDGAFREMVVSDVKIYACNKCGKTFKSDEQVCTHPPRSW